MRGVGAGKRLWAGWSRTFRLPSSVASQAASVAVNLAVTDTAAAGYFTLLGAQAFTESIYLQVSNLNVSRPFQTVSNHAITSVTSSGIECYSSGGGDIVCDLVGYYTGTKASINRAARVNPAPPPAVPPYTLSVPRIGRSIETWEGSANPVVNSGRAWHWAGTGFAGQGLAYAVFAHRTDAGGPFRNVHWLRAGDLVDVYTADQRKFTYQYEGRELTSGATTQILDATRRVGGEAISLVACTIGYDPAKSGGIWEPTSLKYRIVVRFTLVGWDDIKPLWT